MLDNISDRASQVKNLCRAALEYRRRDWSVIPTSGKKARFEWKTYQKELPDPDLVHDWFSGQDSNIDGIGVICGPVSGGLAVRDFDRLDAYRHWHPLKALRRVGPQHARDLGLRAEVDCTEASKRATPRSVDIREGVGYSGMQRGV